MIELIKKIDQKLDIEVWLCWILILVLILRIPSFLEPYSYGDEMIYLTLGEGIRQGLTLYKDIYDNKPPALYLVAALAGSLFWFKIILAFWNLLTIVLFSKLAKILFPKNTTFAKVSTLIFALLTTIPLFEGNIVNSELFMIGFTIIAFIVLLSKKHNFKSLIVAGVSFGFGALFKIPSIFDIPTIFVFWFLITGQGLGEYIKIFKKSLIVLIGILTPILVTFVWFFYKNSLNEYIIAAFSQNIGYLSSFRPGDVEKNFFIKNFPLIARGLIVVIGSILIFFKRKSLSKGFIFTSLWLLFGLFGVTLSERPYPHYFIQVVPAISIFLGLMFTQKSIEQVLSIIPLTIAFFVPYYFHFYHYPTLSYYSKFVNFATGRISKENYFSTFGNQVNRNYQIAKFIKASTTKNERVFVWEDGSPIYALTRNLPPIKYVAGYHIKDFSNKRQLSNALIENPPTMIVLLPNSENISEISSFLNTKYTEVTLFNEARVYRIKKD